MTAEILIEYIKFMRDNYFQVEVAMQAIGNDKLYHSFQGSVQALDEVILFHEEITANEGDDE